MTTEAVVESVRTNTDRGPITARKNYWASAVGSNISLALDSFLPREIYVGSAGDLNVTFIDGSTSIIKSIAAGTTFHDCCWVTILATSSTAFAISVGY